ncbi:MAG: alanine racemase [Clostridia bacterium]|nr:alanine racemase [Clostridia bacterium]
MIDYFRRTWVEINLDALDHNYETIRAALTPGTEMMAIVKADAYGHGVEHTVRAFTACGCTWFGVSNLEEALQVRTVNPDCDILILGYTPPEHVQTLALNNITQAVFNGEYAALLSAAAVANGVTVSVHVKVDTGMTRLGFVFQDSVADAETILEIAQVCRLPGLYPEGIFTHFSSADEEDGEVFTRLQFDLFLTLIQALKFEGITFRYRHCCNSAATVLYPEMHLDLVRPGIILYGLMPAQWMRGKIDLRPIMRLKSVVSMTKTVEAGTPVSYGRAFVTGGETRIATVPIGYADGYPRMLTGKAKMQVGGVDVPVIGRICMDQCMLDITGAGDVADGMAVTVYSDDPASPLCVDALAASIGTINYELTCGVNKRVPRIYTRGDSLEAVANYMK